MPVHILLFVEGFLSFLSPCILPMLPIYLLYLAGDKSNSKQLLINTLGFITGFTVIFVALGATATSLGSLLQSHRHELQVASSLIIVILGIYYIIQDSPRLYKLMMFIKGNKTDDSTGIKEHKIEHPHFLSSMIFGMSFCASWTPCLFTWLASALTLSANSATVFTGMIMLFVFSAGLGVPFLISALLFGRLKSAISAINRHTKKIQVASGLLLVLLGLAMLTGFFSDYVALFS